MDGLTLADNPQFDTAFEPVDANAKDDLDHFIMVDGKQVAGRHLIIDLMGARHLTDEDRIQQAFRDCVKACGATLLHIHTHVSSRFGVGRDGGRRPLPIRRVEPEQVRDRVARRRVDPLVPVEREMSECAVGDQRIPDRQRALCADPAPAKVERGEGAVAPWRRRADRLG